LRIGGIGLAALARGGHPRPGGQFGRQIHHLLTIGQSLFAMRLPMPWHPPIAHIRSGQRFASASIAAYLAASAAYRPRPAMALITGHDLDRCRALVRAHRRQLPDLAARSTGRKRVGLLCRTRSSSRAEFPNLDGRCNRRVQEFNLDIFTAAGSW
jgi:hypothetical protein